MMHYALERPDGARLPAVRGEKLDQVDTIARQRYPGYRYETDERVALLVEVGAIPYRERYEGRHPA